MNPNPQDTSHSNSVIHVDLSLGTFVEREIQKGPLFENPHFHYLGQGDEATVFAFDKYAVKIKKPSETVLFNDPSIYLKLQNEVPLFPQLFAYKEDQYVITERVHGKTLGDIGLRSIQELQFFPEELKSQLTTGLEQALEKGILPRDIHLNNILLTDDQKRLKVVDVGGFHLVHENYTNVMNERYRNNDLLYNMIQKTG